MNKELKAHLEYLVWDAFILNKDVLPIVVIKRLSSSYLDVPKYEIVNLVSAYLYEMKVREHCENAGHLLQDDSFGGPEHGYMGVVCTRCGYNEGQYLY